MGDVDPQPGEQEEPATEEKPQDEQSDTEAEDTSKAEGEEPPQEEGGEDKGGETEPEPEKKAKRPGGWQRRIEKLEQEKEILLQQLQRTGTPAPTAATKPDKEKTAEEKAEDYIDSLVERRLAVKEQQRQATEAVEAFQRRTAEVRAKHPDFDEVVRSVNIPADSPLGQALLTCPHGPDIIYEFGDDPALLARIAALPPVAAVREVGRLEAKFASSTAAPNGSQRTTAKRPPPAPITPVTARGPTQVKPVEQMSYEEYSAWRQSQSKR